jgi:hypothetical protein
MCAKEANGFFGGIGFRHQIKIGLGGQNGGDAFAY